MSWHYQSLAHFPCCPPLLLPFICLFTPPTDVYHVAGTVLRHDTKMEADVLCLRGASGFVGDPMHQHHRVGSAALEVWMNTEEFKRCFDATEELLTFAGVGEESKKRIHTGLNWGQKDKGYTFSCSPVRSNSNLKENSTQNAQPGSS